ncbi:AvrD family protein [Nocardiopsis halotolerans]|uniref:AvrD family protein n=1 Tax=Nocardiopsis halotolerans TaxID=124252 RepID=UPI0004782D17|nr:AvrD family protein [Nocardiopsis halotolerans]
MTSKLLLNSIDDYLGPAGERFFGAGYRRSVYSFSTPVVTDEGFRATVDVNYPADWSKKDVGDDLTPHLSTIDVMVIGARCAETLLERKFGLSEDDIGAAWIRKVVIRAGTSPQEDLVGVPLTATVSKSTPQDDEKRVVSTFDTRVGPMLARVQVEHPAGTESDVDDWSTLGGRADRYWGTGFRQEDQLIENVDVDLNVLRCRADVKLQKVDHAAGLGSRQPSRVTVVDGFVTLLQLAQVLLYELDGLDRSSSDTLWMQQVVLRQGDSSSTARDTGAVSLVISDHQLLDMPDGQWRNAELRGEAGTVAMTAAFAHRVSKSYEETAS